MAIRAGTSHLPATGPSLPPEFPDDHTRLRVAINLLTEDPRNPSGAHWFWTRMVPEMANRLLPGEELHLMLSPSARRRHPDYGDAVRCITFPWSNEHRVLRTASEHLFTPFRLPLSHIDVLNTGLAPLMNPSWSLVIHMKTMHAFTAPDSLSLGARTYRRLNYQRSARLAQAIIINSDSLRSEIDRYLEVDQQKVRLIYEAVDHEIFKPGNREAARAHVTSFGIFRPFVLFVSSLWRYKNCRRLAACLEAGPHELAGRQLVIVGAERDQRYAAQFTRWLTSLASPTTSSSSAACRSRRPHASTRPLTSWSTLRSTRPSGCRSSKRWPAPVPSSPPIRVRCPRLPAGRPCSLILTTRRRSPASILDATGARADGLRTQGLRRAQQFTWGATAEATLDVYREVAEGRQRRR